MTYQDYLLKNRYSQSTITIHKLRIRRFKVWLKQYGISRDQLDYSSLLQYAGYLQREKQYQRASFNNELRAVKLYYDYLIAKGEVTHNPARDMAIRGKRIKVIGSLLSEEELEDLYYSYDSDHYDTFIKASRLKDK